MRSFAFHRDRLFLIGCVAYALNRFVLKPACDAPFLHSHFNDLWLIPCALPVLLWIHRKFGWRGGGMPTAAEVYGHLLVWSVLFEAVGPVLVSRATGDPLDILCYWLGGLVAWAWWNRDGLGLRLRRA